MSKGYDEFYGLLAQVINHYSSLEDQREKNAYRRDITELFHEINSSLRRLSENVKSCDTILADSIGRLLFNINNLIVGLIDDEEFRDEKEELKKRLGWNIHLPYWFTHHAETFNGGSSPFNTLTDSVAKTGILVAERLGDKELVLDCINCLYSITQQTLKKTTNNYGYDEPRVLEKACYLGILALKKGWDEVVIEIGLKIYEFEPKFFAKYLTRLPADIDPMNHNVIGLPHHDQLVRELWRWRDDYERERRNGSLRIRDDAEAMMYQVIERTDIDRFIFEVWGEFLEDSEIGEEIEFRFVRTRLLNILRHITREKGGAMNRVDISS